jgi:hypothetical protein
MATPHVIDGSRFTVHSHTLAGAITVATWLSLCTAFGLEVAPARDPVARLYQMDAERDALARQASRARAPAATYTAGPAAAARLPAAAATGAAAPVPGT